MNTRTIIKYVLCLTLALLMQNCGEKEIEIQAKVTSAEVEAEVNANDVLLDYTKEEKSADDKYNDKILLLEGQITSIDTMFARARLSKPDTSNGMGAKIVEWLVDHVNDLHLSLENELITGSGADSTLWAVHAYFPTESLNDIDDLKLNDKVKIKCKCTGISTIDEVDENKKLKRHLKTVMLRGCVVQK